MSKREIPDQDQDPSAKRARTSAIDIQTEDSKPSASEKVLKSATNEYLCIGNVSISLRMQDSRGRRYSVKRINLAQASSRNITAAMLEDECDQKESFEHANLIRYFRNFYSLDGAYFHIVNENLESGSLADQVHANPAPTEERITEWLEQIASGLNYMHEMGVLHGDLTPKNVLLTASGKIKINTPTVLHAHTKAEALIYTSHERCNGLPYDGRDDMWAVGCILAELLAKTRLMETCRSPLSHPTLPPAVQRRRQLLQVAGQASNRLGAEILPHLLSPLQEQRYAAQQLVDVFRDVQAPEPEVYADPPTTANRPMESPEAMPSPIPLGRAQPLSWHVLAGRHIPALPTTSTPLPQPGRDSGQPRADEVMSSLSAPARLNLVDFGDDSWEEAAFLSALEEAGAGVPMTGTSSDRGEPGNAGPGTVSSMPPPTTARRTSAAPPSMEVFLEGKAVDTVQQQKKVAAQLEATYSSRATQKLVDMLRLPASPILQKAIVLLRVMCADDKPRADWYYSFACPKLFHLLQEGDHAFKVQVLHTLLLFNPLVLLSNGIEMSIALPTAVTLLSKGSDSAKGYCAKYLASLAEKPQLRISIVAAHAIPPLVQLVGRTEQTVTRIWAAQALANLACSADTHRNILAARAVVPLVQLLKDTVGESKYDAGEQASVEALNALAADTVCVQDIARERGVPFIVRSLHRGKERTLVAAASVLAKLCMARLTTRSEERQAIPYLAQMLKRRKEKASAAAANALLSLVSTCAENRQAVVEAGAVPTLLLRAQDSSSEGRGFIGRVLCIVGECSPVAKAAAESSGYKLLSSTQPEEQLPVQATISATTFDSTLQPALSLPAAQRVQMEDDAHATGKTTSTHAPASLTSELRNPDGGDLTGHHLAPLIAVGTGEGASNSSTCSSRDRPVEVTMLDGATDEFIPQLARVLRECGPSASATETAVEALKTLSGDEAHATAITAAGAVPSLVELLERGADRVKVHSLGALWNLAVQNRSVQAALTEDIVSSVLLLLSESADQQIRDGAAALQALTAERA